MKEKNDDILDDIEYHSKQMEYLNYIRNADMSQYDINFVNLYREGKIVIKGKNYNTKDLYIELGTENGKNKILLIYYKNPNEDILTGEIKKDFKRNDLFLFYNSMCFYQIYSMYKSKIENNTLIIPDDNMDKIKNIIYIFNGSIHNGTPETEYMNLEEKKYSTENNK